MNIYNKKMIRNDNWYGGENQFYQTEKKDGRKRLKKLNRN